MITRLPSWKPLALQHLPFGHLNSFLPSILFSLLMADLGIVQTPLLIYHCKVLLPLLLIIGIAAFYHYRDLNLEL